MAVNVSDDLRETARRDPEGIALIEPRTDRHVTWAEFDQWADRVAQTLLSRGVLAGQRVALVMANGIDLAVAYYGVLRGGMVAVPINPRATPREISRMVEACAPKIVVGDAQSITQVRQADTGESLIVVHRAAPEEGELRFGALLEHAVDSTPVAPADPESLAVVLFTSGATGLPRGVMLTHRALSADIDQLLRIDHPPVITPDDVVLGLLPMFHVYGLNCVLSLSVRAGAAVVLVEEFDPSGLLSEIAEHGITNLPVAPPVISAWVGLEGLREALAGVRLIVSGASALDPELAEAFHALSGQPVEQGYGLTETAPVVTTTVGDGREPGVVPPAGSVGRPLPGVEIALRDFLGQRAAPGDPAQIFVRGDNLFSGYWPDGEDGPDAEGWWGTGDIGLLDDAGNLVLVDRLRETITVSGFNVYPSEIEEAVAEAPGVASVAVIGVPDDRTGEAVVAFVVPEDPEGDAAPVETAVRELAAQRLARFKVPSRILVVAALPHSPTGKVAKGRLRALARKELT
ncbi:class I adenylate-forming enzyme family protein [Aeromicrobium duanguangcaii]|uniref:AMP-binding protein n=1 Tax=Aeromicrobium duanguangcaii TaxID=2968086 RepID=A0ABY5KGL0_9ACTN|nr:AMP-binding protein [Aeromicrobium duanguangcaii]MCD9154040.1 AMP-binding protein [Aeromicrobium duanguangcaii]UUI68883.1 AMP-binding protein [Aeromicrobium duanguangcaii]